MRTSVGLGLLLIVAFCLTFSVSAEEMTAEQVFKKALENRQAIHSFEIEAQFELERLSIATASAEADPSEIVGGQQELPTPRFHYYQDHSSFRRDRIEWDGRKELLPETIDFKQFQYWDQFVLRPQRNRSFNYQRVPQKIHSIQISTDPDQKSRNSEAILFLGLHTTCLLHKTGIPECRQYSPPAATEGVVREELLEDIPCLHLSFTRETGAKFQYWIAPSLGYSPVRAQIEQTHQSGMSIQQDIRLTVEEWQDSGLWFPTSYHSTMTLHPHWTMIEKATLKIHSLNQPLPEATFETKERMASEGKPFTAPPGADKR